MIRSLELRNFKGFQKARLPFGPLTLLVGANASGKSNVREALQFFHGRALGYNYYEVIDEKRGPGGTLIWKGPRGGVPEIAYRGGRSFSLQVETDDGGFSIHVDLDRPQKGLISGEETGGDSPESWARPFVDMHFLDLVPEAMREASLPKQTLGDRGENLSSALLEISNDPEREEALLEWLRALTPMDVRDLRFREDLQRRVLAYLVEEDGLEISAYSASDGTLRFLALIAALLRPDPGGFFFFEEIDNGIHPTRLHVLLDVLEQASRQHCRQIVATTHNPQLLTFLSAESRRDAVLLYRREGSGSAEAVRIADLPEIERVLERRDLGRLFAAGWLEDVVELTAPEPAA